jgi:transposase
MSLLLKPGVRVFIYSEEIDMRAGFSRLQALVAEKMKENLFQGNLFLFLGKNPRRAKVLLFDGSGLVLIVKRLDAGSFMRAADLFEAREITVEELERILDGVNLRVVYAAAKAKRESKAIA